MATKRPLNECEHCSYTWYPRGKNLSRQCPQCGSRRVKIVKTPFVVNVIILAVLAVGAVWLVNATQTTDDRRQAERQTSSATATDSKPRSSTPKKPEKPTAPRENEDTTTEERPEVVSTEETEEAAEKQASTTEPTETPDTEGESQEEKPPPKAMIVSDSGIEVVSHKEGTPAPDDKKLIAKGTVKNQTAGTHLVEVVLRLDNGAEVKPPRPMMIDAGETKSYQVSYPREHRVKYVLVRTRSQ